jgi:hypothetical protein
MPGAAMHCLNTIQPIFGCDAHKAIPPPPPAPPPFTPHVVVWGVGWSQKVNFLGMAKATSKAASPESGAAKPVSAGWGYACGRTHDGGPHPGHIWPNLLLPVIMLGAGTKAEFASGTVKLATGAGTKDMAIGVGYVVNFNLDCFDFPMPPAPSGLAVTAANPVFAGFTWADFGRGLAGMVIDAAITWAVGAVCAVATGALGGLLNRAGGGSVFGRMAEGIGQNFRGPWASSIFTSEAPGFFARSGSLFVDSMGAIVQAAKNLPVDTMVTTVVGYGLGTWGLGTPLGFSPAYSPVGGGEAGDDTAFGTRTSDSPSAAATKWVDGLFR